MKFQQIIFALNRIIQVLISLEYTLLNIIPKSIVTLQFFKLLIVQIKAYIQGFQMRYQSFFGSLISKQLQLIFRFYGCSICSDNHCMYRQITVFVQKPYFWLNIRCLACLGFLAFLAFLDCQVCLASSHYYEVSAFLACF